MPTASLAQIRAFFEGDPQLPTIPDHVRRIVELMKDEDVNFEELGRHVAQDPSLTLRVMRLANSAAYGQAKAVSSLPRAFAVIGLEHLSAVLTGIVSMGRCEAFVGDARFDWGDFWGHCSGTAFVATSLTRRLGLRLDGAEFLGGLLHDIGYLALAKFGKVRFRSAVKDAVERHGFLPETLRNKFGISVAEAGQVLAEVSKLPVEIGEVIAHIHQPAEARAEVKELTSVVSMANELAHLAGMTYFRGTGDLEVVVPELPAWQILLPKFPAMATWDVERLVFELEREFEASQAFVQETRSEG